MGKTSDVTPEQVAVIKTLSKNGFKQIDIAEQVGCSQATVSKCVKKDGSRRANCGRKRLTTTRDDRKLARLVRQNRFSSSQDLTAEWNKTGNIISERTTRRRLAELHYKPRVPAVKPLLNAKQRQKRLRWCKQRRDWTPEQWASVMFSDESNFCISFGDQGPRVWRKTGEAHLAQCVKKSVKHPQCVMVWGAMSVTGVGPLCFLKGTVNSAVYQEVLESFLVPAAEDLFGDADFIFQQDLAPPHSAKTTKNGSVIMGLKSWIGLQTHLT